MVKPTCIKISTFLDEKGDVFTVFPGFTCTVKYHYKPHRLQALESRLGQSMPTQPQALKMFVSVHRTSFDILSNRLTPSLIMEKRENLPSFVLT